MNRSLRKYLAASAALAVAPAAMIMTAAPASATVHEIVGQWCSGQGELSPPGISGGSKADNFAKPLEASGFIGEELAEHDDGLRIVFNYDRPNSKVVGTGEFVQVGFVPVGPGPDDTVPLYLELIKPDPTFPAFRHCPKLATG
ncbi:hypothetical protein ACQE98_00575 [Ornithinimicrobium sp. W1679]|uniref:hypothetical protein n=1 Tax=Ornithinimicrobium sp. W1679 TaxID=3418770 RepID=UPI003CF2FE2B